MLSLGAGFGKTPFQHINEGLSYVEEMRVEPPTSTDCNIGSLELRSGTRLAEYHESRKSMWVALLTPYR